MSSSTVYYVGSCSGGVEEITNYVCSFEVFSLLCLPYAKPRIDSVLGHPMLLFTGSTTGPCGPFLSPGHVGFPDLPRDCFDL